MSYQTNKIDKEIHRKVFELTLALYRVTDFFPKWESLRKQLREKANEIFGGMAEYDYSGNHGQDALSITARIQAMKGYLKIARELNFVRPINITVLIREYDFLDRFFAKELVTAVRDGELKKEPVLNKKTESFAEKNDPYKNIPYDEIEELKTWRDFTADGVLSPQNSEIDLYSTPPAPEAVNIKSENAFPGLTHISEDINDRQKKIIEYIQQKNRAKISDFFSVFGDISSKTIQRDLQNLVERNMLKKEGAKRWTVYSLLSDNFTIEAEPL